MKIAILGGGYTGLTAAYHLIKQGHDVTLFEKGTSVGGLAVGFKHKAWEWSLERAYHHLFSSDSDILSFAKEVGFNDIFFSTPRTDSLYGEKGDYRIFPVDSPQEFLKFPLLSPIAKLRAAVVLAWLKLTPFLSLYESTTAEQFVTKTMGEKMWSVFFEELFHKKFGRYEKEILTSFLWARINKRTPALGYVEGGFQRFIEHVQHVDENLGVQIHTHTLVENLEKKNSYFSLTSKSEHKTIRHEFDAIISTLPTPVLTTISKDVLPASYINKLRRLQYLSALVMILETDRPILEKSYWLNICTRDIPVMLIGQHTNFIDKKHYNNKHIAYLANYLSPDDPLLLKSDREIFDHYMQSIKTIFPNYKSKNSNYWIFRAPYAQPIFNKTFLKNKPDFETPINNFYIANLDMTYPYDRGTNFAVRLGKQVADVVKKNNK